MQVTKTLNERITRYCQVTLETMAYAGTGDVLKVQQMLSIAGEHIEVEDGEAWKVMAASLGSGPHPDRYPDDSSNSQSHGGRSIGEAWSFAGRESVIAIEISRGKRGGGVWLWACMWRTRGPRPSATGALQQCLFLGSHFLADGSYSEGQHGASDTHRRRVRN